MTAAGGIEPLVYDPPADPLEILHRDDDLLVVNKPSGLLSVPGKAEEHKDCLQSRIEAEDPQALLVHRLDMDTSGVMVFARNKAAQRHLGLQFEKRVLKKTYEALCWGVPSQPFGAIDLPLRTDWPNRPLQMVDHKEGKPALTDWEVIDDDGETSRIRLQPLTGRSHQLRVHLKELGHVILGDRFYAKGLALTAAPRLCLHAKTLSLRHPTGGEWQTFTAPVPF